MNLVESTEYHQNYGKYNRKELQLASKDFCTGCGACAAVCPVHAISMKTDEKTGFLYPFPDMEKCIHCGGCEKICCINHLFPDEKYREYSDVYAVNNRSMQVRHRSASGGAFSAIATTMLKCGGSVVGVALSEHHTCRHVMIESESELEPLEGTKYFQSDMTGIYEKILNKVKAGNKEVMFCGTPCQVCAVKSYAKEKGIEERMILVDLLCRGIPSPYVYQKYIELLEKEYRKKVLNVHMKEKTMGWNKIGTMVTFEDGSMEYIAKDDSLFLKSFIETNLSIRESCFHCRHKTIYREGDITIADFWGLKNNHLLDNKGTSLVILSTEKGRKFFEQAKQYLDYIPSTMWRAYKGNGAAFHKVFCDPQQRSSFFELLHMGKDIRKAIYEVLYHEP